MSIKGYLAKKYINSVSGSILDSDVLFHSSTSENNENILKNGIIPRKGEWLQEVLNGAIDSDEMYDEIINDENDIAFYSKEPSWVSAKVAKKLEKFVGDITWNDIKEHGQLSIVFYKEYDEETFKHAIDKWNNGYVEKSYFLDSDEIADHELPFGVETNDIYTDQDIVPDITLTGDELINFLKTNYPKANIVKDLNNSKIRPK